MTGVTLSALTPSALLLALVALIVGAFLSGKIVSGKVADSRYKAYEAQIARDNAARVTEVERVRLFHNDEMTRARADAADWRDVARAKDAVNAEQTRQISELVEGARTTHAIVRSIPVGSARREGEGSE